MPTPADEKTTPDPSPVEDKFYPTPKSDVKADPSPATPNSSETPVTPDTGAVQTVAAPEPAETEQEPEDKSKSPRSSWAEMRQARYRAEAEAEFLRKELERRKADPSPATPPAEPPVDPLKPKSEHFAEYEDFLDARDAYNRRLWEAEQAAKQKQADDAKAVEDATKRSAKLTEDWNARELIVSGKSPNYPHAFETFIGIARANPALATAVFESEFGPDVAHYLGSHPAELARFAKLAPSPLLKELGKLEDKLSTTGSTTPTVTQAPPPLGDVAGPASTAAKELTLEERFYGKN